MANQIKINYSKNQKVIADFLSSKGYVEKETQNEYAQLFNKDYPFPIYKSVIKILATIFTTIFCCMLFFSFIFKEWVGVLLGIVFIFVCLIFFNFVRKVKYPNERFSIMIITLLSVLSTITIGYYFLNYETVYSNLYYLNYLYNRGEVASDIYFEVLKFTKINLYFTIFISIGMLIFGVVSSKRRLSSILTPMIVCIGLLLSVFIYNYALDSKFLVDTFANKKWMFYLITVGSLLSLAIFDLIFIKVAKICGGKPSELRSKGE